MHLQEEKEKHKMTKGSTGKGCLSCSYFILFFIFTWRAEESRDMAGCFT